MEKAVKHGHPIEIDGEVMAAVPHAEHIKSLTAFRGVAALLVVAFHYLGAFLPSLTPSGYTFFISKGYLWVDFFFLLSGFVLTHVYLGKFQDRLRFRDLKVFIFARFSRIYPLHLIVLMGYLGLEAVRYILTTFEVGYATFSTFTGSQSLGALLSNLLLTQATGIHDRLTWNGPAWSIGAEWFAYLAFPILVIGLMRRTAWVAASIIAASLAGLAVISDWGRYLDVTYDYGLLRCLFGFVIGMLLHRFRDAAKQAHLGSDVACAGIIVALVLAMHFGLRDILIPPVMALLVLGLSLNAGLVSRGLSHPMLLWLGAISYSVYMFHMLLLSAVNTAAVTLLGRPIGRFLDTGQSLALFFVMTMLVLAGATLLHRYAEIKAPSALKKSRFATRHVYT